MGRTLPPGRGPISGSACVAREQGRTRTYVRKLAVRTATSIAWVEGVAQAVPEQVEGQHGHRDGRAGEDEQPGRVRQEASSTCQHLAPVGCRRLHAQAKERQPGHAEYREADAEGSLHAERTESRR